MDNELSQQPVTIANSSGFPLQIGITNIVQQTSRWSVLLEEHPWRAGDTGEEGFIDLVVANPRSPFETFVIECKRVRQTAWVFLIPSIPAPMRSQATVFGSLVEGVSWRHYGCENWQADPITYQSQFCAIPGQQQGRKNLLERTASELVISIEALANQERKLVQENGVNNFSRVYVPVIVTTAHLYVAEIDPSGISMNDGSLKSDTLFNEIQYIRYRKSLSTFVNPKIAKTINEFHLKSERTIFVINALYFKEFLLKYEFRD